MRYAFTMPIKSDRIMVRRALQAQEGARKVATTLPALLF